MIRILNYEDIPLINNLINDKNYIINNFELKKDSYVFFENKEPVAFISYSKFYERAELNYIFVDPFFRKKGIASKLIEYMIDDCKNNGVNSIDLEVNSLNKNAIKLYEKYDFKIISIRKKYYDGIDGMLMLKEIR